MSVDTRSWSKNVGQSEPCAERVCVPAVKKALSGVKGVSTVHVSYKEKQAHIEYEKGKAEVEEMIKAVEGLGYSATLKQGGR